MNEAGQLVWPLGKLPLHIGYHSKLEGEADKSRHALIYDFSI